MTQVVDGDLDQTPADHARHTKHGEEQQEALTRAAFDLIAERGFEGLRTRDVAARAGVNIATLHYYFPSKEDLIRAVLAAAVARFRRRQSPDSAAAGAAPADPLGELRTFLQTRQKQMRESPELFAVLLELSTRALRDPGIRAIMRRTDEEWREHLAGYLRAGVEAGQLRPDLDVQAAAVSLVALSKGLHLQMIMTSDDLVDDRFNVEIEQWLTGQPETTAP